MTEAAPHSAEWIEDSRLDWWSTEHLASILQRHGIAGAYNILDVGTGGGHWAAKLAMALDVPQTITGVDFEAHWVAQSAAYFAKTLPQHSFASVPGQANALPFADGSFDLVTCQTVLMHCADPLAVLAEMLRVLKPGGWLLLAEPINSLNHLGTPALLTADAAAAAATWKFAAVYRAAKLRAGQGDNNLAATVPSLLAALEAELLGAYQTERVTIDDTLDPAGYTAQYDEPEVRQRWLAAGITLAEIEDAKAVQHRMIEALKRSGITKLASPMPLLLFVAWKTAD